MSGARVVVRWFWHLEGSCWPDEKITFKLYKHIYTYKRISFWFRQRVNSMVPYDLSDILTVTYPPLSLFLVHIITLLTPCRPPFPFQSDYCALDVLCCSPTPTTVMIFYFPDFCSYCSYSHLTFWNQEPLLRENKPYLSFWVRDTLLNKPFQFHLFTWKFGDFSLQGNDLS